VASLKGLLQCLLDTQQSVQIVSEHHLAGRMRQWPLIVLPECEYLEPAFRSELIDYVKAGGSLLAVGPRTAALFQKELDVELADEANVRPVYLEQDGYLAGLSTLAQKAKLGPRARAFGQLYSEDDLRGPWDPAASVARLEKGRIAAVYCNLAERHVNGRTSVARDLLGALVRDLFPKPLVEVSGSHCVDVSVMRSRGRLAVNLVNTAGPHAEASQYVYDEVPALGPLAVVVRTSGSPAKVTLEPGAQALEFTRRDGALHVVVPRLEIHRVLVIE
jgi:hypothetical protein